MKKLLFIAAVLLLTSCKKQMLTSGTWELFKYEQKSPDTKVRFNNNGTFYYEENGTPKGEETLNQWKLEGDNLTLHWKGIYVDKTNTLRVTKLDNDGLNMVNDNVDEIIKPNLIFFKTGSPALKLQNN